MTLSKEGKKDGQVAKKHARNPPSQKKKTGKKPLPLLGQDLDFGLLFDYIPAPVAILDDRGAIMRVNRRFESLSGYTRESIEGKKTWTEFVSNVDVTRIPEGFHGFLDSNVRPTIQYPVVFVDSQGRLQEMLAITGSVPETQQIVIVLADSTAQARYRELVDADTPFAIMTTDPDGVITMFSAGSERMLGYRKDEVVGRATPLIFLTESEIAARSRKIADESGMPAIGFGILSRFAQSRGTDEREWTCIRRNGTSLMVTLTVTVMRDAIGRISGYLCIAQQNTDQKRVEESFRTSTLQMSGVIYNLPDATFAIDRDGRVIAWNRAIEELTGVNAVDILGKGNYGYALPFFQCRRPLLIDLITANDRKIESWGYTAIQRTKNSVTAEISARQTPGRTMIMQSVAAPIYDEAGNRAGAIESIVDITELRMRESALEDLVSRYRTILDNTGAATAIIEADFTFTFINPEFEKVLGYTREEIVGKRKLAEFVAPDEPAIVEKFVELRTTEPQKTSYKFEFRFIRWDGGIRNGLATITAIPETTQTVISLLDITDKIQAEDACQLANRKLNFFNAITRHEILNQLTSLRGNLELSLGQTSDDSARVVLKKELAAADAIENLILFTRDYQDIGIQPPQWQDLGTVVRKACADVPTGSISVEIVLDGVAVYADQLLEKVFFHLVSNTIQYGEKASRIRISCSESFEELLIVCEDDGIGIQQNAKETIFHNHLINKTGLDLFLSREILSLTGIGIKESGIYGKGARFELSVPKGAYRFTSGTGS